MRSEPRIPDFVFAAEAYWDLEWDLQQLGFDYCYDKRLYDRLIHDGPDAVRGHLHADLDYQRRLRALPREPRRAARRRRVRTGRRSGRRPSSSPRCPARRCGTRVSSKAGGCASRCSSAGGRRAGRRGAPPFPPRADRRRRRHGGVATGRLCERERMARRFQLDAAPGVVVDRRRAAIADRDQLRRRAGGRAHPSAVERSRRTDVATRRPPVRPGVRTRRDEIATEGLYVQLAPWEFHVLAWTDEPGVHA